jgi:hypothetical protein
MCARALARAARPRARRDCAWNEVEMPPNKRRGRQQSISFKAARFSKEDAVGGTIVGGGLRAGSLLMGAGMDGTGTAKSRYIVMGEDSLEYFTSKETRAAVKPLGIIEFVDVLRVISLPDSPKSFAVQAQYRTYHLTAGSVAERDAWAAAIEQAVDDFQEFKDLAESDENDSSQLVAQLEGTLGSSATTEQSDLLEALRRTLANAQEKMMQSNQRAAIKAEEAEVFRDLQEIANTKLSAVSTQAATISLLRKKIQKLENNTSAIRFVLESADEHVREIQMLLQMPSFDQRALEAKETQFADLLGQITQIMADCELLANRSFTDEQLQAASPDANPALREEIADMKRHVAAVRMQGLARAWLSQRALDRAAADEAARIAAEPPWEELAEMRIAQARVQVASSVVVMNADGSVIHRATKLKPQLEPEPELEPRTEAAAEVVRIDVAGGAVRLNFDNVSGGDRCVPLRSVLRPSSFPMGFVAMDPPTFAEQVEVAERDDIPRHYKHKHQHTRHHKPSPAAPPVPGVATTSSADEGRGGDDDDDIEMNPALMAMLGAGTDSGYASADGEAQPQGQEEQEVNPALMMMVEASDDGCAANGGGAEQASSSDEEDVEMNPALMAMLGDD